VKQYPKDKEYRRFKLGADVTTRTKEHIEANGLGPEDLLFQMPATADPAPVPSVLEPDPAEKYVPGTKCEHGTISGYSGGKCRCARCKSAYATYRRVRRQKEGKDRPNKGQIRVVDTDGHIPRDWFRIQVWRPALEAAKVDIQVPTKNLRHAHASWLLHGGADLQVVKERMGHAKISTTERYLGTLPDVDETAVDALAKVRNRSRQGSPSGARSKGLSA
jgi:hypothetical protein